MKKQTAVEWLYAHLLPYLESTDPKVMHHFRLCLNEAKVIEQEQIQDAWDLGRRDIDYPANGEQYYNKTYKELEQ